VNQQSDSLTEQKKTLRDRGICVVIPTYNNARTLADVITRTLQQCNDVIVVNDGSCDDTPIILKNFDQITIVSSNKNKGKGAALKKGFSKALSMGFAYAITIDADGQHFPEDIPLLLKANQKYPGALIIGQRKNLKNVVRSAGSKFANGFSNFWFYIQTGYRLKDTQTGYRLYPLKKLYGLRFLTSRYEAELELLVFSSWHGVELISIPVNVYYPPASERVSHFRPVKDFSRIFILNTVLCFLAIIYGWPLSILRFICMLGRTLYSYFFFLFFSLVVLTPGTLLYLKLGKITERKRYNIHRILNFMARIVMIHHGIPGCKYSVANPHNEDFSKPGILICNHQSHLDLMPLLALHPKICVLTNNREYNSPFYGYIIRNAEFLSTSEDIDQFLTKVTSLVQRGYSIAIYPEGTRSDDCSIGRFHQGAFFLAHKLNADIIPLVLYGTGRALPKHEYLKLRKSPIRLEIDERISTTQLSHYGETLKEQASYMRKYYKHRYTEIVNKIEQNV